MIAFHFAGRPGRGYTPRILAVTMEQYPGRALSFSRWMEIRAIMESA